VNDLLESDPPDRNDDVDPELGGYEDAFDPEFSGDFHLDLGGGDDD
jgi:hypothetical protein